MTVLFPVMLSRKTVEMSVIVGWKQVPIQHFPIYCKAQVPGQVLGNKEVFNDFHKGTNPWLIKICSDIFH